MASVPKSSGSSNSALLIASVVSIVAIVGLVILFKGGASGNLVAMQGEPGGYSFGIGEASARGTRMVSDPTNCPPEEGFTGTAYYDFNEKFLGCAGQVSFPSPLGSKQQRYSGTEGEPKSYRASDGGMYSGDDTTSETFYRGEYGTAYREGIDRTTLPTASRRGELG